MTEGEHCAGERRKWMNSNVLADLDNGGKRRAFKQDGNPLLLFPLLLSPVSSPYCKSKRPKIAGSCWPHRPSLSLLGAYHQRLRSKETESKTDADKRREEEEARRPKKKIKEFSCLFSRGFLSAHWWDRKERLKAYSYHHHLLSGYYKHLFTS